MTAKKKTARKSKKAPPTSGRAVGSATLASILGTPQQQAAATPSAASVKPQWVKYFDSLVGLRHQLKAQMDGLAKESTEEISNYSLHMADSGTDNFDRDFALSLLSSDQDAVYEIDEALRRIEKGSFGVCELTDKPIPKARLEAIPWTRFTVEAQAQLEKDGAGTSRRLGSRGTVDSAGGFDSSEDDDSDSKGTKD